MAPCFIGSGVSAMFECVTMFPCYRVSIITRTLQPGYETFNVAVQHET
jgi:hypothetical protein